jgi:hypothetical protein
MIFGREQLDQMARDAKTQRDHELLETRRWMKEQKQFKLVSDCCRTKNITLDHEGRVMCGKCKKECNAIGVHHGL